MKRQGTHGIAIVEAKKKGMRVEPNGDIIGTRGNVLSAQVGNTGYLRFSVLCPGIGRISTEVHKLQAYQKFGDLIFGENVHIRHLDGNKLNNSWDNIGIGTQSDNILDIPKKTRIQSAKIAASKRKRFSDGQIRTIRGRRKEGFTLREIAEEFKTTKGHISEIVNRKIYSDIE